MAAKTDGGERRKLTDKCDVIMHDTDKGMLVVVDNQDTDEYTLKFDFGNSENVTMNVCEGVKVLDEKEKRCEVVVAGNTAKNLADMNIDKMELGTMSVKYKTNISVKRSGTSVTSTSSTTKEDTSSAAPAASPPAASSAKTTTTTTTTTTSSSSSSSPPKSSSGSTHTSMSMQGSVQEEKKPEKAKASPEEERKIGPDVYFAIKKNFEGYIVYVDNRSANPAVITSDFATTTGGTPKANAGVQSKNATTFVLRVEEKRKLPICKVIASDKNKIDEVKILYKADVAADLSANALGDMHAKLKAKADAREKAEAEARERGEPAPGGNPAAGGGGDKPGATSSGGAMVAGAALKESLAKLDAERKITDTLTFIVKASVDGYVTYLESKDEDPYVVTVDFAGTSNLNITKMVGCTNVEGEKYQMTIDPNRKFPFVKMPLADKTSRDWSLKYSFTYKNDNSARQAADKMRKARERASQ